MSSDPSRFRSSIGRPLDPRWPTNRAVMILLPVAAVVSAAVAVLTGANAGLRPLFVGGGGAATVLGSWALGRELAPDDQRAAFVSLVLAFTTFLLLPGQSLLLLFSALLLSRIVNRTVGPPPSLGDSLVVVALVGVTTVRTDSPLLGLVAAGAFTLDAALPDGRRSQWGFAGLCLILAGAFELGLLPWAGPAGSLRMPLSSSWLVLATSATALFVVAMRRTDRLTSRSDLTGEQLSARRVRAGMAVALSLALLSLLGGARAAAEAGLIWATLAGVGVSALLPGVAGAD